jgi:hypothetical protein
MNDGMEKPAAGDRNWLEAAAAARAQRPGRIAREVQDCLGIDPVPTAESQDERRVAVATALADIAPGDEVEGMLTTHLLSTHALAMDCVRSASVGVADDRLRLAYMAQAGRLLSLYARSVDRLERRREWSEWRARAARERAQESAIYRALSGQPAPLPAGRSPA